MTFFRTAAALFLTSLLAACGGQAGNAPSLQLASVTTGVGASASTAAPSAITPATTATTATTAATTTAATAAATMPAPDCAAEGCASLRIIDGNAEAWRIDAQRRAADLARL